MAGSNPQAANGLRALQQGNAREAYAMLSEAASSGDNDALTLRGLALAARAVGRPEDSLSAAEKLLASMPGDVEAMIIKADALSAKGEDRKAAGIYMSAVQAAPPQTPAPLAREIERAKRECANAAVRYEEFLRAKVRDLGLFDGSGRARGEQALDVLFGRRQIYYQQPEKFYFPELPQIQFYDSAEFPWAKDIISQSDVIGSELNALLAEEDGFEPYVPAATQTPHLQSNVLMGNADWGAFHMKKDGVTVEKNAARCPETIKTLEMAPQAQVRGKSPIALFSRLKPGAHIPPHTGLMNTRIICHLPLIAPEGCALRVGNQERTWRIGEMLIFDDSIEHEAYNQSRSDRIILLFDIWRPELSEDERAFISTLFESIEDYGVFA